MHIIVPATPTWLDLSTQIAARHAPPQSCTMAPPPLPVGMWPHAHLLQAQQCRLDGGAGHPGLLGPLRRQALIERPDVLRARHSLRLLLAQGLEGAAGGQVHGLQPDPAPSRQRGSGGEVECRGKPSSPRGEGAQVRLASRVATGSSYHPAPSASYAQSCKAAASPSHSRVVCSQQPEERGCAGWDGGRLMLNAWACVGTAWCTMPARRRMGRGRRIK